MWSYEKICEMLEYCDRKRKEIMKDTNEKRRKASLKDLEVIREYWETEKENIKKLKLF